MADTKTDTKAGADTTTATERAAARTAKPSGETAKASEASREVAPAPPRRAAVVEAPLVNATGQVDRKAWDAKREEVKKTGSDTHKAIQRGYAIDPDSKAGVVIEEGEIVPAGQPVSDQWMEAISKKKEKGAPSAALAAALEEVTADRKDDPDLTQLDEPALQAMAVLMGVTRVKGLDKDDLITVINAVKEQRRN